MLQGMPPRPYPPSTSSRSVRNISENVTINNETQRNIVDLIEYMTQEELHGIEYSKNSRNR